MLKARVLTALALVAVLVPALFFLPQVAWAVCVAVIAGIGAWEWGAFMRLGQVGRLSYGVAVTALCLGALALPESVGVLRFSEATLPVYVLAGAFWGGIVPLWLSRKWPLGRGAGGFIAGIVVLYPSWLAMVQLRALGPMTLLAVLILVWIADIAAYFSGKAFGRHKLAPTISPGKTWEGVAGACVGVVIYGVAVLTGMSITLPLFVLVPSLLAVTAVSVIGDLFESLLKRQVGMKDSSQILPGHGGVMDRVDSLTSTLPVVALLSMIFGTQIS